MAESSAWLFSWVLAGYAGVFLAYLVWMSLPRVHGVELGVRFLVWGVVAMHALALLLRWIAGGIAHPPWTNLYESLVFFGFMLAVIYAISTIWVHHPWMGLLVQGILVLVLGIAFLTPAKTVQYVVPALRSTWLYIHVLMGAIGYSLAIVGSCFSFLYLLKDGIHTSIVQRLTLAVGMILFLASLGLSFVESGGEIQVIEAVRQAGGWVLMQGKLDPDGPVVQKWITIPKLGTLAIWVLTILGCGLAMSFIRSNRQLPIHSMVFGIQCVAMIGILGIIGGYVATVMDAPNMTFVAHPYRLAGWVLTATLLAGSLIYQIWGEKIRESLPNAERLDLLAYTVNTLAFPVLTMLLLTGAIWAHRAWGRYWGWDPKETAALFTWLVYATYVHVRLTMKKSGRIPAWISVFGFWCVVFTYLGVNLLLAGLHSYASQ